MDGEAMGWHLTQEQAGYEWRIMGTWAFDGTMIGRQPAKEAQMVRLQGGEWRGVVGRRVMGAFETDQAQFGVEPRVERPMQTESA